MRLVLRTGYTLTAVVCLFLFCSCGKDEAPVASEEFAGPPRLVIMYVPCSVSNLHLAPYNEDVTYTPNLLAFSKQGTVFQRHQTESGQSGIAYAAFYSGLHAMKHGVYAHPSKLDDSLYLMSEAFADNGYEAFFWDAQLMASRALNYAQGVEGAAHFPALFTGDAPGFKAILAKLKADPDYKAFVMANFTVTHGPYDKRHLPSFRKAYPEECKAVQNITPADVERLHTLYLENYFQLSYNFPEVVKRLGMTPSDIEELVGFLEVLYKSNIHYLDSLFGGVVDGVKDSGLLDESLIVFSADHGEVLYRENAPFKWTHGHALTPEVLNVPLVISAPCVGVPTGRYEGVSRSIDVFPTVAALAGLSMPEGLQLMGQDLSSAVLGKDAPPLLQAYSHTSLIPKPVTEKCTSWGLFRSFYPRTDINLVWTLMRDADTVCKWRNQGGEVFGCAIHDLHADPSELTNLYDPNDPGHQEALAGTKAYKDELAQAYEAANTAEPASVSRDEQVELLKGLGYME